MLNISNLKIIVSICLAGAAIPALAQMLTHSDGVQIVNALSIIAFVYANFSIVPLFFATFILGLISFVFFITRKTVPRHPIRKYGVWIAFTASLTAFSITFYGIYSDLTEKANKFTAEKKQQAEKETKAQARLDELCKTAGLFVYEKRPAKDFENLLIMRLRPTDNKYWYGKQDAYDPIGGYYLDIGQNLSDGVWGNLGYFTAILSQKQSPILPVNFLVISLDNQVYYLVQAKVKPDLNLTFIVKPLPAKPDIKLGLYYEDTTTPDDREMWIASSKYQIIDLVSNHILVEHIAHMRDPSFGKVAGRNQNPWDWHGSLNTNCPARQDSTQFDFKQFINSSIQEGTTK